MKREEDQELWDLLGKAKQPELSPFFARNVVRRIRQADAEQTSAWDWLRPRRLVPATAVALAVAVTAFSLQYRAARNDDSMDNLPELLAKIDPQDYDVVADLDDLLAADDENLWGEPSSL
jgi:hypothetical protein